MSAVPLLVLPLDAEHCWKVKVVMPCGYVAILIFQFVNRCSGCSADFHVQYRGDSTVSYGVWLKTASPLLSSPWDTIGDERTIGDEHTIE